MAPYGGKNQQSMGMQWQIARKIDRLDIGSFAATEFFYRTAIIFGIVRALDPEEQRDLEKFPMKPGEKTIPDLIASVDKRIKELLCTDTTALLMGRLNLKECQDFQIKTMSAYYELMEIVARCKLIETVKVAGEEI